MWLYKRTESISSNFGHWFAVVVIGQDGVETSSIIKFDKEPSTIDAILAGQDYALQRTLMDSPTYEIDSMTREVFFSRFTPQEIAMIYAAAAADMNVFAFVKLAEINPTINRTHPKVTQGLQSFEAAGLLAAGRANQILGFA